MEFEYIREEVGYGTIDLLCDVGGTLSLLMGASLLTCCELLEVAWIYLLQKCCAVFPTAGPALNNVAKFILPIATGDQPIDTNAPIGLNRRESDAQFPTKNCKSAVTIAIKTPIQDDGRTEGNAQVRVVPTNNHQTNTRKCKLSQLQGDTNKDGSHNEVVSVVYVAADKNGVENGGNVKSTHCKRRISSCKSHKHYLNDACHGSSSSIDVLSRSASKSHTHRSDVASPSTDDGVYKSRAYSTPDPLQGDAQVQTPNSRSNKKENREGYKDRASSSRSSYESEHTRYLFHHFPPSTEAQKFYRNIANGGDDSYSNRSLSTSYMHTGEVSRPLHCSKSPPSPNLYIVHASTGPSLASAYLPNGNAIKSRSTATSATSTPPGANCIQKTYCKKRDGVRNVSSGASMIRGSADILNSTKSSRKSKGLHLGSEELIV